MLVEIPQQQQKKKYTNKNLVLHTHFVVKMWRELVLRERERMRETKREIITKTQLRDTTKIATTAQKKISRWSNKSYLSKTVKTALCLKGGVKIHWLLHYPYLSHNFSKNHKIVEYGLRMLALLLLLLLLAIAFTLCCSAVHCFILHTLCTSTYRTTSHHISMFNAARRKHILSFAFAPHSTVCFAWTAAAATADILFYLAMNSHRNRDDWNECWDKTETIGLFRSFFRNSFMHGSMMMMMMMTSWMKEKDSLNDRFPLDRLLKCKYFYSISLLWHDKRIVVRWK